MNIAALRHKWDAVCQTVYREYLSLLNWRLLSRLIHYLAYVHVVPVAGHINWYPLSNMIHFGTQVRRARCHCSRLMSGQKIHPHTCRQTNT